MDLTVTSSPHIRGNQSTRSIMRDVVIALLPALAFGIYRFGARALLVTAVCVVCAVITELAANRFLFRDGRKFDGSAVVTGMLLAMTLPTAVSCRVAAIGSVFAIAVAKALCGGMGQNIFNPALAARALLVLVFPSHLVRFTTVDGVTAATPLHHMAMNALPEESLADLFLGNIPGCIGEVSALALLLGGAYLVCRRVISLRIPAAYTGTVTVLTLIFHKTGDPLGWMIYSVLGGGLLLGSIFMATDYATSPVTPRGQLLYGIGCGVLTVLLRYLGLFPEGVTYAILIMNAAAWTLDKHTPPVRFGCGKGGAA